MTYAWESANAQGGDANYIPHKEVFTMLYLPQEAGQGLIEYSLILVLVAVVVIAILSMLGPVVGNIFSNIYMSV